MVEKLRGGNELYKGRFVIVEMGGSSPDYSSKSMMGNVEAPKGAGEPLFLGIDISRKGLRTRQKKRGHSAAMMERDIASKKFIVGNELDQSVDRLFAHNVLSVAATDEKPGQYRSYEFVSKFMEKLSRMLKPDGVAMIAEWMAPENMYEVHRMDFSPWGLKATIVREPTDVVPELMRAGIKNDMLVHLTNRLRTRTVTHLPDIHLQPFLLVLTRA